MIIFSTLKSAKPLGRQSACSVPHGVLRLWSHFQLGNWPEMVINFYGIIEIIMFSSYFLSMSDLCMFGDILKERENGN